MKHKVTEYKLPSGAQGLVINVPGTSVVSMAVSVKAGSLFADPNKYELPHILEHVMFSGAGDYPTSMEFKKEVEKNGAQLSATTYKTDILYEYLCSADEAERILDLLVMQLVDPKMPEDSFVSEVSNVREELERNTTDHMNVCSVNLYSQMMPKGFKTEKVRLKQLPTITRQDAFDYYLRTHTAENMRFFIAGSFEDDGRALVKRFERGISSLKTGEHYDYPIESNIALERPLVEQRDLQSLYYNFTACADSHNIGLADRVALSVATGLLTGGWQSWVYGEARERGLAYHIASSFSRSPNVARLSFYYQVSNDNASELFKLITKQSLRLREGKFTSRDMQWIKDLRRGTFILAHQTPGSLVDWYYPHYVFEGAIRTPEEYIQQFERVTPAEVTKAWNGIWAQKRTGLSLVGQVRPQLADELYKIVKPIWE